MEEGAEVLQGLSLEAHNTPPPEGDDVHPYFPRKKPILSSLWWGVCVCVFANGFLNIFCKVGCSRPPPTPFQGFRKGASTFLQKMPF